MTVNLILVFSFTANVAAHVKLHFYTRENDLQYHLTANSQQFSNSRLVYVFLFGGSSKIHIEGVETKEEMSHDWGVEKSNKNVDVIVTRPLSISTIRSNNDLLDSFIKR